MATFHRLYISSLISLGASVVPTVYQSWSPLGHPGMLIVVVSLLVRVMVKVPSWLSVIASIPTPAAPSCQLIPSTPSCQSVPSAPTTEPTLISVISERVTIRSLPERNALSTPRPSCPSIPSSHGGPWMPWGPIGHVSHVAQVAPIAPEAKLI